MLRPKKPCLESLIDYFYILIGLRDQAQEVTVIKSPRNLLTENLNEPTFPGKLNPILPIIQTMTESYI